MKKLSNKEANAIEFIAGELNLLFTVETGEDDEEYYVKDWEYGKTYSIEDAVSILLDEASFKKGLPKEELETLQNI